MSKKFRIFFLKEERVVTLFSEVIIGDNVQITDKLIVITPPSRLEPLLDGGGRILIKHCFPGEEYAYTMGKDDVDEVRSVNPPIGYRMVIEEEPDAKNVSDKSNI